MKCLLPGRRTALIVCQAISIAMTVVLPAPVASFRARRSSSGLASLLAAARCSRICLPLFGLGRDLGQPDGRFHGFHLAEERPDAAELVMPPVLEQPRRFGRHLPLAGIGPGPPAVHMTAHLVDDRGGIVLLLLGRKSLALVENEVSAGRCLLALLRLGDRRDELSPATVFDDLLGRLALFIELPMPLWAFVRGVEDRVVKEGVGHRQILLAYI